MEGLERIVREHPFFADMEEGFCKLVCGCAKNVRFEAGQYLCHEGEPADQFYLLAMAALRWRSRHPVAE